MLRTYGGLINEAIDICFEEGSVSNEFRTKLRKMAKLSIIKDDFSSYMSGVVFAGFGRKERFPTVVDFSLEGIISGVLKKKENQIFDATRGSGGFIKPFAQGDMVFRFMEGVDPHYQTYLEGLFLKQIIDNFGKIFETYHQGEEEEKEAEAEKVAQEALNVLREMRKKAGEYRERNFVSPITNMLDALPKEELANLAESLVSLTALKRKVSEDVETVGGAIDVAVISKGDGFIWIKRKHYFDPYLNPSFMQKYMRE